MKDHADDYRSFVHSSRAWWGADTLRDVDARHIDEVIFQLNSPQLRSGGELIMRWYPTSDRPVPQLEVLSNSWSALATMPDLIYELDRRSGKVMTPAEFCALLLSLGFRDDTPTENPNAGAGEPEKCPTCGAVRGEHAAQ